ncbi:hypothetical protein FEM48_Zijuj09G0166800 [Ziziphus jujuba var. spinosa]|uniref:FAD-binding domain-containing protein n=1 Tax=Ziziphus jujuba var. spinosa TaxID=714518 RepID=A0A978UU42_ZIZJJ|nr:hypothetical protein FEM48_Zijuj09G0166800 [Ziziphus jujuba var. spinosa]
MVRSSSSAANTISDLPQQSAPAVPPPPSPVSLSSLSRFFFTAAATTSKHHLLPQELKAKRKSINKAMEVIEDVVIVGAGIAGLTTSLGLYRQGIRSLVLESSDSLRITGFALLTWTNAWKALDAVGIGDSLRQRHELLRGNVTSSTISGLQTSKMSFVAKGKHGEHEVRCLRRKLLLEALANELPSGTIRYSSKVVSIEESGYFKLIHLADGNIIKTKVLIGCDGVNSVVAKWLGFKKPAFTGRSGFRGCANFNTKHDFKPMLMQFFGHERELEEDKPELTRQYVMSKLGNIPEQVRAVIENTELDAFLSSPLRYRHPWELLWGNISKGNVCVAGDALHPMTPDLGQGGCSALEDGFVLARCLEGNGKIISFLRDKFFAPVLADLQLKRADFDCGKII